MGGGGSGPSTPRCDTYAKIGDDEPRAMFFQDDNCNGNTMALTPGDYYDLSKLKLGINSNEITSMIIPPNMRVTGYERPSYNSGCNDCKQGTYDGSVPGKGIWTNLSDQHEGTIGNDDIDSMHIVRLKDWTQYKVDCCNNSGTPDKCQQFWGGSNTGACSNVMSNFCNSGNLGSNNTCKTWCIAHPGQCDNAAIAYCRSNPSDPFCACLNSPLKAPSCFDKNCMNGGYRTQAMMELTNHCPTIVECNQNVTIDKNSYNNIVSNLNMQQTCVADSGASSGGSSGGGGGSGSPTVVNNNTNIPASGGATAGGSSGMLNNPLVWVGVILLFVVIAAMIAMGGGDDDSDDYFDDYYGYGMQPQSAYAYGYGYQ